MQGDSGITNLRGISWQSKSTDYPSEAQDVSIAEIQKNDYAGDPSGTEDTYIADSKFWIINKETILGY